MEDDYTTKREVKKFKARYGMRVSGKRAFLVERLIVERAEKTQQNASRQAPAGDTRS